MKKIITITMLLISLVHLNSIAQEKYGNTINLGVGIGYYGYSGVMLPVLHANYEIDVAKDFTLAPFITYYSYGRNYNWGDANHPLRTYSYHETVVPIGVKGTYYFDDLLKANPKWDFYLAGSLGFAITNSTGGLDNVDNNNYYYQASSLYIDLHIGTEYHLNSNIGVYLDLSTGVSTIGLAIH